MKKLSAWVLVLMVVPGLVALTGCKKAEEGGVEVEQPTTEPMMEATPAPAATEPMMEATPMMDATPGATTGMDMGAAPTASPAAQ